MEIRYIEGPHSTSLAKDQLYEMKVASHACRDYENGALLTHEGDDYIIGGRPTGIFGEEGRLFLDIPVSFEYNHGKGFYTARVDCNNGLVVSITSIN